MSDPEKMKEDETEEEIDDSNEEWSDEESAMRQIVLGLPALRISQNIGDSSVAVEDEEEARLNEQAVVAAELVITAAEEAVMKERSVGKKKKTWRPKKIKKLEDLAGGSGEVGKAKKPRKKASELTFTPQGPPVCNICGRGFRSWKAVFGHLRSHKDRNYTGFYPPFKAAQVFTIPGPNSAFVLVPAGRGMGGGSSGGSVTPAGGGAQGSEGGRGLGIDLNVDLVEEEEDQEVTQSEAIAKFDLNKPPPKNEEEEHKTN